LARVECRVKQRELLDFLVRCQQIAFDALGKKMQSALAFFAGCDLQAVLLQALGYPGREVAAIHRVQPNGHAKALERAKPGALGAQAVEFGQQHQCQRGVVTLGALGNLLECQRAVFAGLAAGNADFYNLLVGKQTQ
jgi:hypothetical protein